MKRLATVLLGLMSFAPAANAADTACLRGDNIDSVTMVSADRATASDRDHRLFDITFVGACGARHLNVFFILRPESLPTCIVPSTAFHTNREGVCVIKAISAR
jgi:hypothetical protein